MNNRKLIKQLLSLVSAFSLILIAFLLPETVCAPGSEVNACCAAGNCETAMASCLCCHPGRNSMAATDDSGLPSIAKSVPLGNVVPTLKVGQSLPPMLLVRHQIASRNFADIAYEAKPSKLYLLKRSLLI